MDWPYHFVTLSEAQRHERRILLDRYGLYAQLSGFLVPVTLFLLLKLAHRILRKASDRSVAYDAVPTSPGVKHQRINPTNSLSARLRRALWWLGGDVGFAGQNLGRRDELISGGVWTTWLLFLCVNETGSGMLF
jgi:hypothetical protein